MEAPLHHSPVPTPMPVLPAAPPRDAIVVGAVLQQVSAATAAAARNPPPAAAAAVVMGREQCPRCASRDTKFCYYNNYNTAQPRHFCRACRRYWTLGGSLRNVPVGGSSRKRPRPARGPTRAALAAMTMTSSSSTAATTTAAASPVLIGPAAAAATVTAHQSGGLLSSLLLGSVPLLEGRLGFDLGFGQPQPAARSTTGAGPFLWPTTAVLEGDRAAETTAWKSGAGALFPPPAAAALWQELAAAMPAGAGAGVLL